MAGKRIGDVLVRPRQVTGTELVVDANLDARGGDEVCLHRYTLCNPSVSVYALFSMTSLDVPALPPKTVACRLRVPQG